VQRRSLLKSGLGIAGAKLLSSASRVFAEIPGELAASYSTHNRRWQAAYDKALEILAANVQLLPRYEKPVLIEGSQYGGIWQECGPHESLVYRHFRPDVARNSHLTFFALQRSDGQLPANNKRTETGFGQIQMVVPIAATAWELAAMTGDSELLEAAYQACSKWDAWLTRYRDTRGSGLTEGFCTYDTGMDNSPRWAGIPSRCPDADARRCPPVSTLPRLCPDLSATVYGARVALAAMAAALGRNEAWHEQVERTRKLIVTRLYSPQDASFYDLDARGHFVKVRSDILTRVCGEHVIDQKMFDEIWERQLGNPRAFWATLPFPSIALDDPAFVRPIPHNSWGGASQVLTALRAGRWMDHYGRSAEFAHLMEQWCEALQRDTQFRQQVDPLTGVFTDGDLPNYSPACLLMYDFTWRLAGVRQEFNELHWNIRPGKSVSENAQFSLKTKSGIARMDYADNGAKLQLSGREVARVRGTARLVGDNSGKPIALVGVSMAPSDVELRLPGRPKQSYSLRPNQRISVT
jgi:hypothetical protein